MNFTSAIIKAYKIDGKTAEKIAYEFSMDPEIVRQVIEASKQHDFPIQAQRWS